MAGTLILDTLSSSGGTITVDNAKTLALGTDKLTIGGTPITTGALGTLSKAASYDIDTSDYTGKSVLTVFVNASAGTATTFDIKLPTAANFATCSINVVSTHEHGAGNSIPVKDNAGNEMYTLYAKGDHAEIQSDGTTEFRTGNEYCTIRGQNALTASVYHGATTRIDSFATATSTNYDVLEDVGLGWQTATDDYKVPQTGWYRFGGKVVSHTAIYITGWQIYNTTQTVEYNFISPTTNMAYGSMNINEFPILLTKDDVITFHTSNHSSAEYMRGAANQNDERSALHWWLVRRA